VIWTDNAANEDGFTTEYCHFAKRKWTLVATSQGLPNSPAAWFPNPLSGKSRFRVRAYNAYGASAWSNWADLTIGHSLP
jgi:hypothetical protein